MSDAPRPTQKSPATGPRPDAPRKRISWLPDTYSGVCHVIKVFSGRALDDIKALQEAVKALGGTRQARTDFSDPPTWIPELPNEHSSTATKIWQERVNPRYVHRELALIKNYDLMTTIKGVQQPSDRGEDFMGDESGSVVAEIDEVEGLMEVLSIVRSLGDARKRDVLRKWSEGFATRPEKWTANTISSALTQRLRYLSSRGLIQMNGAMCSLSRDGRTRLYERLGDDNVKEIEFRVEEQLQAVKNKIGKTIDQMAARDFELLVTSLLEEMNYDTEHVGFRAEGGADIVAKFEMPPSVVTVAVEVKHHKRPIPGSVVHILRGTFRRHGASRGIVVTNRTFEPAAEQSAEAEVKEPVTLVDRSALLDLLVKHRLGAIRHRVDVYDFDEASLPGVGESQADGEFEGEDAED